MPTTRETVKPVSERLFGVLLRLLPEEFRRRFGAEMESLFRDQRNDALHGNRAAQLRFWWDTTTGLLAAILREHGEILLQDAAYALRMMRKNLGFTVVAITILGLAIGAGTAAFSAADAILIQPLPFGDGNRLVQLTQAQPAAGIAQLPFSVHEIEDYRSRNHTLESVVEYHQMMFSLLGGREPERVDTAVVSANFFRVLDVTPLYGRTFLDEDDRPSAHPVLILSYEFWQRSLGGDPSVVGKIFSMNDKQHVVVGILPPIPQFPTTVDVYMPTAACPIRSGKDFVSNRNSRMMSAYAVLKPDVTLQQARDDLRDLARHLQAEYPDAYPAARGYGIDVTPVHEQLTTDIRPVLLALAVAALLLLLLACSNVSGLMLSRMLSRSRELTVRAAMGASRARIVRSFVTEGVLLALGGGVLGMCLACWSINILVPFASRYTTLATELRVGPQVVVFCFVLSMTCGFLIGFVPAIGLRQTPLFSAQIEGVNLTGRMGSRARGILVGLQLAFSVVLLVGAGLTLRTLFELEHLDGGFRPSGVTTARIYKMKDGERKFYDSLLERTGRLDGVQSVALASTFPLSNRGDDYQTEVDTSESAGSPSAKPQFAGGRAITPGYFQTVGTPILAGRDFTAEDNDQRPLVVIVNQHLATHYWPSGSAIGKRISFSPTEKATIVGVVGDVRYRGLDKDPYDEAFCPFAQAHISHMNLLVRSTRPSSSLAPEISWIAHDLDPEVVVADIQALSQVRQNSLETRRNTALFFSIFAILALAITASGISGLMALEVTERKHEIGIRIALGATAGRVMRSMMIRVLAIIVGGLACGFAAAWLMSASMAKLIYGIVPRDSATFAVSSVLLVLIAITSSLVPLTRIARLDPTVLLKAE